MSLQETGSNRITFDGIRFETVLPDQVVSVPDKRSGSQSWLSFGVRICNGTEVSHKFLLFFSRPEFFHINRQKVLRSGPNINGSYNPQLSDFKVLAPGSCLTFLNQGRFEWLDNTLNFVYREQDGTTWIFSPFQTGSYFLQVIYENPYSAWVEPEIYNSQADFRHLVHLKPLWKEEVHEDLDNRIKAENVWTGEVFTPPIRLQLT